jgi:hypothetical protein
MLPSAPCHWTLSLHISTNPQHFGCKMARGFHPKTQAGGRGNGSIHMTVLQAAPSREVVPGTLEMLQCNAITFGQAKRGGEQDNKGCLHTMWVGSRFWDSSPECAKCRNNGATRVGAPDGKHEAAIKCSIVHSLRGILHASMQRLHLTTHIWKQVRLQRPDLLTLSSARAT